MARRGAPFGNQNARKAGRASKSGPGTKGLRAHLSSHINFGGAKFQAALRRQKRYRPGKY